MDQPTSPPPFPRAWAWSGLLLALIAVAVFVFALPPSFLGHLDYIGAAVCHRLPEHSFFLDGEQLPLCQRCTGTFPGALTGLLLQWGVLRRRRAARFPALWVWGGVILCVGLFGLDGINSYTTLLTGNARGLLGYAPQPWLRLLTGTLTGLSMSIVLVPAFNQTLWRDGDPEVRTLRKAGDLALLVGVELAQAAAIYSLEPWLLYPIAFYSTLGVVAMFVLLGTMVFVMALGRDASCAGWREAAVPFLWGIVFAALLIGGMDLFRLWLTGTLVGVPGL